jgi:ketosteroid isomerase-like protein
VTPSANLALVRSIYANWERGDYSSTDWADPDIEWVMADGPNPGTWIGLAGMAEGWRGWVSAWEEFRVGAEEFLELDKERILVLTYGSGRGKTSGVELGHVRSKGAALFRIRDGKVARLVFYWKRELAFADLGLAPEPSSPS